jgi:drug/metabolite transporter (DMT)-like permease
VLAVVLALASSAAYGCADFFGGLAARHMPVLRTVMIAAPVSLLTMVALLPWLGATWSPAAVLWGGASGIASAFAFALLYQSLAIGPMSVISPITALVSAVLPVAVGIGEGERTDAWGIAGVAMALVAVVLVSSNQPEQHTRVTRHALLLAVGSGTAIATQLVCLHQSPTDSGVAPLIAGRVVSSFLLVSTALLLRQGSLAGVRRSDIVLAAAAGALDSTANLAFLLASRHGELAVVAVITALYPASTVLLARFALSERIHRAQLGGLALAAAAVVLLALA